MAESNTNCKHVFPNLEIRQKLEKMLNNEKFSDTVFLVNKSRFHASSHLVSVSSATLGSMLDEHFENCGDREIKIDHVKQDVSFSIILRYINGLDIDFDAMSKNVLCEVLDLSERFGLSNFSKELKNYVSNLASFNIDYIVVLLNSAKKYHIELLYLNLRRFALINADALVKHDSFVELQYDVLLELIKDDHFCTGEIDILRGVLKWHTDNLKEESGFKETSFQMEKVKHGFKETLFQMEKVKHFVGYVLKLLHIVKNDEESREVSNVSPDDKFSQLVKSFSDNVLKTLLSHIRAKRILLDDFLNASQTELFRSYELLDPKHFSQSCELRLWKISKTVNISCHNLGTTFEEEVLFEITKMKLCVTDNDYMLDGTPCKNMRVVRFDLKCAYEELMSLKYDMFLNVHFKKPHYLTHEYLPSQDIHFLLRFSDQHTSERIYIGSVFYPSSSHDYESNPQEFSIDITCIWFFNREESMLCQLTL